MTREQTQGHDHEPATAGAPPIGRHYEVGGRRLFLHRSGSGGPAVVILPGASAVGLDYLNIHDRVAEFTTSVLYDRAGTGFSDPVELPRSATDAAVELHDLLRAAGVPGPYVLVAHSLGGAYARRFAQLYADQVAGLVLMEAFYEAWDDHMPESLHLAKTQTSNPGRLPTWLVRLATRRIYAKMLADWPKEIRELLVDRHISAEWLRSAAKERTGLPELRDELKAGGSAPDVPLIVLTALAIDPGQRLLMSKKAMRENTEGKLRLYAALANSVTRGEHRTLEDANHSSLHTERPDAVAKAIKDVLDMVKA